MKRFGFGLALGLAGAALTAGEARATQVAVSATLIQTPATVDYPALPASGDAVRYLIVVMNVGDEVITSMSVSDTLPAQITGVATDQPGGFTLTVLPGPSGTLFAWDGGALTMNPGDSYTFTMTGRAGDSCVPAVVSNTAFVTAAGASTAGAASSNPAGFPLVFTVQLQHSLSPGTPNALQPATYVLNVVNTGSSTIDAITLTDTLPSQITSPSVWSTTTTGTWGLEVADVPGSGTRFVWTGTGVNLPPGGVISFTLTGTVAEVCVSYTASNTARVEAMSACTSTAIDAGLIAFSKNVGQPLLPPLGLTTRAGDGWATVVWQPDENERTLYVTRWYVWRSLTPSGTYVWTGTVFGTIQSSDFDTRAWWDKGLINGVTYYYRVQAASGCVTLFSDEVAVTPMTATALSDSGKFGTVFHQAGDGYVRLNWASNPFPGETNVNTYKIQRGTAAGTNVWTPLSTVSNAGFTFDFGLANGFEYWYMLTPCCPDRSPSFLSARAYRPARGVIQPAISTNPACPRGVRIAWEPAEAGTYTPLSGYAVFRSDDGGATLGRVGTTSAAVLSFIDCTVPVYGKRYLYLIRPIDAQGNLGDAYPSAIIDVVLPTIRTYPDKNRFRPGRGESVNIVFQTTEPGRVRISVWTPGGELVRTLHDQEYTGYLTVDTPFNSRDRGLSPLVWDGTNENRELVGSGAYLIVIEVNGKRDFRSVAVLR